MFEKKHERVVSTQAFVNRMLTFISLAILLISIALGIGICGYHYLAGFDWIDSLLNASMILGGMGPVGVLPNVPAKIFASLYALFSGLVFIALMGITLTPLIHRVLHKFHVENK